MTGLVDVARSFIATRWRSRAGQSRAQFDRWQNAAVTSWIKTKVPRVGFYDRSARALTDLPVTDKATLMGAFDQFNTHGLDAQTAWAIQSSGGRRGDLTIGASTGTSGNRGLFVISEAEKLRWLGSIVAKTMADLVWKPQRVAIILPADTGLYSSANRLRFIQLRTFSTLTPAATWRAELEAFNPTVIVAPPQMLRQFADQGFALSPVRIFSAAETLDGLDQTRIEAYFSQPLRLIYMATEGLLGVGCAHGTLHLCEDAIAFEFEDVGAGLCSPLITSFRRDTQIMARYRMNDLVRLSDAPCPCGSPLRAVDEVVGRMDDIFTFAGGIQITPDVLRNAVIDADRAITDFRLVQKSDHHVTLSVPAQIDGTAAQTAVADLIARFGATADVSLKRGDLPPIDGTKLRRVRSEVTP